MRSSRASGPDVIICAATVVAAAATAAAARSTGGAISHTTNLPPHTRASCMQEPAGQISSCFQHPNVTKQIPSTVEPTTVQTGSPRAVNGSELDVKGTDYCRVTTELGCWQTFSSPVSLFTRSPVVNFTICR